MLHDPNPLTRVRCWKTVVAVVALIAASTVARGDCTAPCEILADIRPPGEFPGNGSFSRYHNRLFWLNQRGMLCSPPASIHSAWIGSTPEPAIVRDGDCGTFNPRMLRIETNGGAYLYFVNATLPHNTIERVWRSDRDAQRGEDPFCHDPAPGGLCVVLEAFGPVRALADDSNHVYWADTAGIHRFLKPDRPADPLVRETIVPGADVQSLAIWRNSTFLYWAEGNHVKRALKEPDSTASDFITSSDPVLHVQTPWKATPARVVAADAKGRILSRCTAIFGCETTQTLYEPSPPTTPSGLAADDDHVYWSTPDNGGFVYRIPRSGGVAPTALVAGLATPEHLDLSYQFVYFRTETALNRVPKDVEVTVPDLSIEAVEVTQGIQDLDNSVVLVDHKRTFVRVYPKAEFAGADAVDVELVLTEFFSKESTILRLEASKAVQDLPLDRADLGRSFLFELPPPFNSGVLEIVTRINPLRSVAESNVSNNERQDLVYFQAMPPLCIALKKVKVQEFGAPPRVYSPFEEPDFWDIFFRAGSILPHRGLWPELLGGTLTERGLFQDSAFEFRKRRDRNKILRRIGRIEVRDRGGLCQGFGAKKHRVGAIHPAMTAGPAGFALFRKNASWVKMNAGRGGADYDSPVAGGVLVQEIAHNYNGSFRNRRWQHIRCGDNSRTNNAYPYCRDRNGDGNIRSPECCQIALPPEDPGDPPESHTFWGFDTLNQGVVRPFDPTGARDFMSTRTNRIWVSDYNWTGAYERFRRDPINRSAVARCRESTCEESEEASFAEPVVLFHPACDSGSTDCCVGQPAQTGEPGCSDAACCELVCACDPYCCDVSWDERCAGGGMTESTCSAASLCGECFPSNAEFLLVGGEVVADRHAVQLEPGYLVNSDIIEAEKLDALLSAASDAAAEPDAFQAELLDSAENALVTRSFLREPTSEHHDDQSAAGFDVLLPWNPAAKALRIRQDGHTLARRTISSTAPSISIVSPAGGDVVTDLLEIEWQSDDPDGDHVFHTVQYSQDFGESWQTLALDVPNDPGGSTTVLQVDISSVPGSRSGSLPGSCLVRVFATDGILTGMDVAGPFFVERRSPLVRISTPRPGAIFHHSEPLFLHGFAFDPEDGPVTDPDLVWYLNGVVLPTSNRRQLTVGSHAPGEYTYRFCAHDDDNGEQPFPFVCDEVTITVRGGGPIDDHDHDGIEDSIDNCPGPNAGQEDADGDTVGDRCDNCPQTFNPDQADQEEDGLGDACDACPTSFRNDYDGDGICSFIDVCPEDADPDQTDTDGDGIGDACDNCPTVFDTTEIDCDDDGVGDACQIESGTALDCNGNGRPDVCDLAFGGSSDRNDDGIPDECTEEICSGTDPDNDLLVGECDNCPVVTNWGQVDLDADGEGDHCDTDDGMIYVGFASVERFQWDDEEGFSSWNAYRGDLTLLRDTGTYTQQSGSNPLAQQFCGLLEPLLDDALAPAPGEGAIYLTTGVGLGTENDLGTDSEDTVRPNTNPCPF